MLMTRGGWNVNSVRTARQAAQLPFSGFLLVASCGPAGTRDFVQSGAAFQALTHVRVIDGTGVGSKQDQTLTIRDRRITGLGPSTVAAAPAGAQVVDLSGRTVIPGLVGMHEHLFYGIEESSGVHYFPAQRSFATLYLATGVTIMRTAYAHRCEPRLARRNTNTATSDTPVNTGHVRSCEISNAPTVPCAAAMSGAGS